MAVEPLNNNWLNQCKFPDSLKVFTGCLNERDVCVPEWEAVFVKYTPLCAPCFCLQDNSTSTSPNCYRVNCKLLECSAKNSSGCCQLCTQFGVKKIAVDINCLLVLILIMIFIYLMFRKRRVQTMDSFMFNEPDFLLMTKYIPKSNLFSANICEPPKYSEAFKNDPPPYNENQEKPVVEEKTIEEKPIEEAATEKKDGRVI
ncbi:hypothetical protein RF11_10144 [Thelohanellus kitauei]|uniref:Uncharacterized protein n=1 Tax=Thelohanellus kitauei TaxID=669202 RepID=A0A0C2JA69_THEKT|nr:hypothetical protein RF11_10144 [Thelohanellus kitauei]